MNTITTMKFLFQMQSELFARELYARWDSFFANNVERVADEVFGKLRIKNEELRIEKLELDLGTILEDDFDKQFPLRFREKLEEAFIQWKIENEGLKIEKNSLSALRHFLLHGALPWDAPEEYKNVHKLFLKVLQENAKELKQFLQTYGHYTSLQQRLVYQLNDPELEQGVQLLTPAASTFIVDYVHFLRAKYNETKQPQTTESNYRNTVWLVVYAYLLNNYSSYFDKKVFLAQTLLQLATKNNLSYEYLLEIITRELERFSERSTIPAELFKLLSELRKELSEQQFNVDFINATIRLSGLKEEEYYELVRKWVSEGSEFVILYAGQLDTARKKGLLEGKAGGEFFHLKWKFIFYVLLQMPEHTFNRRYFVEQTLQRMAAHYNLALFDLLAYFQTAEALIYLPLELQTLLTELFHDETKDCMRIAPNNIRKPDEFKLAEAFIPVGNRGFVQAYAQVLDLHHDKGLLQGKTSGDFRQIKWKIVFEVLLELRKITFNKKQFIERTLHKIAAHYNLTLLDLLSWLCADTYLISGSQYKEVVAVFNELHRIHKPVVKSTSQKSDKTFIEKASSKCLASDPPLSTQFVDNAGIVLLSPFFSRLFDRLKLIQNQQFNDPDMQIRAVFLLQYAVFGTTEFPEHELVLNKLLTGLETGQALPKSMELRQEEKETVESMLKGALQNWPKLKNTSVEGLRQAFLQRNGKLEEQDDYYRLTVEEKPYDMLLDSCPWNFRTIKFPWMKKIMQVKWR